MRMIISILLFLSSCNALCQEYNNVEFENVGINNLYLGSKKALLVAKLGKPKKILKSENPSGDDWWFNYYYNQSTFEVAPDGTFTGFKIIDSNFVFKYRSMSLKVGDSLTKLQRTFILLFNSYKKDKDNKFRLKFKDTDSYLIFNISKGVISKIETWDEL